ncbi:MAG: hypothetical protein IT379_39725 [Deltaproteobacteria bacterium]|nr:hypothetical protein [Deltaproteobacteria bacterium]
MTSQKKFKRRVRERMAETGETYMQARQQLDRPAGGADASPAWRPPSYGTHPQVRCPSCGTLDVVFNQFTGAFVECCECDAGTGFGYCPSCCSDRLAGVGQGGTITCHDCGTRFDEAEWDDEDVDDGAEHVEFNSWPFFPRSPDPDPETDALTACAFCGAYVFRTQAQPRTVSGGDPALQGEYIWCGRCRPARPNRVARYAAAERVAARPRP